MVWQQHYDPLGAAWLSTLLAAAPVVVLLGLLAAGVSAIRSAAAGLATALAVAVLGYRMPAELAFASAGFGACFGLFPIGWLVLAAVFFYRLQVQSGAFDVVKRSVARLSPDRRMQALLVAFSFGAFIEGAAGFGTPVAVSAAMLMGLGFPGLLAAGVSLIANTAPVAFGSLGIPIITLAKMIESDPERLPAVEMALSAMAGRQLPFFAVIVPIWLTAVLSGWRGVRQCWPAILVCGGTFGLLQFLVSNFHGPTAVDVVAGAGSLLALALLLQWWQPKEVFRLPGDSVEKTRGETIDDPPRTVMWAWAPWAALSVFVFLWALPPVKSRMNQLVGTSVEVPRLHNAVARGLEVAKTPTPERAVYEFFPLTAAGTALFTAAVLSAFWLRVPAVDFFRTFGRTLWDMKVALATIAMMLALAYVTKYCGSDGTMGLAFTHAGWWYPFFAPMLGWLGVALTGSDTASNALFGGLQKITAEKLSLDPILICASNSTGGVMGKMIDAQSIVVAAVATNEHGKEGAILRFVFWHSIALACLVGLLTLLQAYSLAWMVPSMSPAP
jgi:lactate permease